MSKALIIYYSQARGNTKRIAGSIHEAKGYDIAQIDTVLPYHGSYEEIVEQGQNEVDAGYQPEIRPLTVNFEDYDKIIIGTPTWWYTMAPAVLTFLNSVDWSGKTVIPFQTHGGWPGHVIEDMKKACRGASFAHEKAIQFDSTGGDELITPEEEINNWIEKL